MCDTHACTRSVSQSAVYEGVYLLLSLVYRGWMGWRHTSRAAAAGRRERSGNYPF